MWYPAYPIPRSGAFAVPPSVGDDSGKPKLLIFIVAYNAEKTIGTCSSAFRRRSRDEYDVEVLVIDDASTDRTFERGTRVAADGSLPVPAHRALQSGQPGLRRQPEDRLFLRHRERLRLRRPGARRRAIRARMPARPAAAAARRRGGCVLRLAHDGARRGAQRAGCRSTNSSATAS